MLTSKNWLQNVSMVAFGRLASGMVATVLFVIVYTIAVAIFAESDVLPVPRWSALLVPVSSPIIVAIMIWFLDKAADAARAARSAAAALVLSKATLVELTVQRKALAERARAILGPPEHVATCQRP